MTKIPDCSWAVQPPTKMEYERAYQMVLSVPFDQFKGFVNGMTSPQLQEVYRRLEGKKSNMRSVCVTLRRQYIKHELAERTIKKMKESMNMGLEQIIISSWERR